MEVEKASKTISSLKPNIASTFKLLTNPKTLEVGVLSIQVFLKRFLPKTAVKNEDIQLIFNYLNESTSKPLPYLSFVKLIYPEGLKIVAQNKRKIQPIQTN